MRRMIQFVHLVAGPLLKNRKSIMTYCQNCGHESHCGTTLQKPLQSYRRELHYKGNVIICAHCRCELCVKGKD